MAETVSSPFSPGPAPAGHAAVDPTGLTTLMLAFTALRDHLGDCGDHRAVDRVHRQVLVNEFHEGPDHYRLLPTQADREAYTACVSSSPQAGGGDDIGAAYRFFLGALAEGQEKRPEGWAATVETVLKDLLSIVEITAEPGDNVYRISESINNTDVGLSQSDLLRNYVRRRPGIQRDGDRRLVSAGHHRGPPGQGHNGEQYMSQQGYERGRLKDGERDAALLLRTG